MSELLLGPVLLAGVLTCWAVALNAPLLLAARLARRRVPQIAAKITLAVGFTTATAHVLWRMEWFDVWRHGGPPVRYVLHAYLPWIAGLGLVGWFAGGLAVRQRRPDPR